MLDKLCAAGMKAWLRFVQWLNGIAVALLGGAIVVHQSYPHLLGEMMGDIPMPVKGAILFGFGTIVHFALGRAKKVAASE